MYLIHRLLGFVPLLILGGLIVLLEHRFSLGVGAAIYAVVVILTTFAGSMLLRSTSLGQSSWRNSLATKLLPCSGIAGSGSLLKLCVFNILGLTFYGLVCFVVARYLRYSDYELGLISAWIIASALAWIVLVGMVLFLVRQYGKNYYGGASGLRKFLTLIATPSGALAASIALVVWGLPFVAFVVAMIPIAIVFVPMGFLLIIVIATKLSGKPFRWN